MIPASPSTTDAFAGPPAAEHGALSAGFYQLTLAAAVIMLVDVRVRPLPGLPSFSLLELIVIPTLLAAFAELAVRPRGAATTSIYRCNRPLVWYIGYAGIASVVGLSRSSDSMQAFHDLAVAFALYALVMITVDTRARLIGFLATNLAVALPGLGLALLQAATGSFYLVPRSQNIEAKLDLAGDAAKNAPTGLAAHPNGLALYLLPIAIFLAVAAWRGFARQRRPSLALGAVLGVALVVLKLSYVKGVYAWLATGLVFLALPRRLERGRFWIAIVMPLVGITFLVWLAVDSFLQGDLQYGTVISRIELWLSSIDILQSDPFVIAVGSGGPQLLTHDILSFEYPNPHNAWISQALTYGVPALILYLAAFVASFRSLARRIATADGATRAIALATLASLVALLGENFFEPADRGTTYQSQLFMLFAVAARVVVPPRGKPP